MISKSDKETKEFAKDLINNLKGPTVLALEGELGAGKTTFVQGLAAELGVEKRVLSPTFVFLRSYGLKNSSFKKFHHFDLYRCTSIEDVKSIGFEEVLQEENSLVVIEWPEVARTLLTENILWVRFKKLGENEREIEVS